MVKKAKNSRLPPRRLSIIVKPTSECNLSCEYCYTDHNSSQERMNDKTLENMISKSLEIHDIVHFIWHGGEPLLMPIEFYEKALNLQRKYPGKKTTNGFQTNGTLVTEEILDFCEEYSFDLGFSLDGPKRINDRTRHFKNKNSSFKKTLKAIKKAQERDVGGGAIVVVNKLNINYLTEIYEFAQTENINLKLNPLIKSGKATINYHDLGIGSAEYGKALTKLFDVWFQDDSSVSIDPFEELMGNILTEEPWGCNYSISCQSSFISIGPEGDIYPCGRFEGIEDFNLGNINENDLYEVLTSEKRGELRQRSSKIEECTSCDYKKICNSGCMHNAYMFTEDIHTKDHYCASYKLLFQHIAGKIEQELEKAEVK